MKRSMTGYTFIHNGNGYCRPTRREAEEMLKDRLDHSKFFGEDPKFSYCGPNGDPIQYARLVVEEGHLIAYEVLETQ